MSLHPNEVVSKVSKLQSLLRKHTLAGSLLCAILFASFSTVDVPQIDGHHRVVVSEVLNCPAYQANGDCVPFEIVSNRGTLELSSDKVDEYDGCATRMTKQKL